MNAKINTISEVDGFPGMDAWNMIADNENNLWVGTGDGLIKSKIVKYKKL